MRAGCDFCAVLENVVMRITCEHADYAGRKSWRRMPQACYAYSLRRVPFQMSSDEVPGRFASVSSSAR
jgi:hypothetical protein